MMMLLLPPATPLRRRERGALPHRAPDGRTRLGLHARPEHGREWHAGAATAGVTCDLCAISTGIPIAYVVAAAASVSRCGPRTWASTAAAVLLSTSLYASFYCGKLVTARGEHELVVKVGTSSP